MTVTRFKRRSINLDDVSHARCKALADNLAVSLSAMLRILIHQAYERQVQEPEIHDHFERGTG
jgi:hypothetical protein